MAAADSSSSELDWPQYSSKDKEIVRRFMFTTGNEDDVEKLVVFVSEVMRPEYGLYTWPCAVVLAQFVWYHRRIFKGAHVLELACGTALPGIVAAKCGARVTLSDSADQKQCLENCKKSCLANGLNVCKTGGDNSDDDALRVDVIPLTWGTFEPNLIDLKGLDFLFASDCFYDPKDFEDILVTIAFILERNVNCKCLCTYQVRSSNWTIEPLLSQWQLHCNHIPLLSFEADCPDLAESNLPGRHSIQMLEFTRKPL